MSYRQKPDGTWVVEIYDRVAKKAHVKARDYGMEVPHTERQAKALERAALNARDGRRRGVRDETCSSFAERWADDYDGRGRGEGTRVRLRQSVKAFGEHDDFTDRPLRSISRDEGRNWAKANPWQVPALARDVQRRDRRQAHRREPVRRARARAVQGAARTSPF
jgi:hypothetical protein